MPSRPRIRWSDLAGASVGVWGLGVEGSANLRRLRALGVRPVVVDDHPRPADPDGVAVLATADGGLDSLAACEVVVKTPGISRYRPDVVALTEAGVPVVGGLGLWLEETDRSRVVAVTGTKGKSTTTALLAHLLSQLGHRCLVAGNIGRLPYDPEVADDGEFVALEVSSFQVTDLSTGPPTVAVTSLSPDHLDWHGSVERYYADKLSLCTLPGVATTVANGDSPELRARAAQLGLRVEWVGGPEPRWVAQLGLPGRHNATNALVARACAVALGVAEAADDDRLAATTGGFAGLDCRLQEVGEIGGVRFVDDSLSTNVLATLAALDTLDGLPAAVLVGGADRGIDYRPLAERLVARPEPTLVVTLPISGARIAREVEGLGAGRLELVAAPDLDAAVAWATPGSVVLLSPAAASFGQFHDYRERSAAFRAAVARHAAGR
jgi:UDP-N-acetylmuramoylalanine-D-glutamate ligase